MRTLQSAPTLKLSSAAQVLAWGVLNLGATEATMAAEALAKRVLEAAER